METTSKKSALSTIAVCDIIKACAHHGVMELQFQDLRLRFRTQTEHPHPGGSSGAHATPPVEAMTEIQHSTNSQQGLELVELELREMQLEELKITNPVMYEQMVRDGELEEDDTDNAAGEEQPE